MELILNNAESIRFISGAIVLVALLQTETLKIKIK